MAPLLIQLLLILWLHWAPRGIGFNICYTLTVGIIILRKSRFWLEQMKYSDSSLDLESLRVSLRVEDWSASMSCPVTWDILRWSLRNSLGEVQRRGWCWLWSYRIMDARFRVVSNVWTIHAQFLLETRVKDGLSISAPTKKIQASFSNFVLDIIRFQIISLWWKIGYTINIVRDSKSLWKESENRLWHSWKTISYNPW